MRWTWVALKRIGDDRGATIGFALLVLVTALLAALAPRVLAALADEAVRAEVRSAPVVARSIVLLEDRTFGQGPDDDPLAEVRNVGDQLFQTFPASIQVLVARRDIQVESGRYRVQKETTDPAFVRLRIQEGIDDHIRYVAGRPPTSTVIARNEVGPQAVNDVPVYEAAISSDTARQFGIELGETVPLVGDQGDQLIGRTPTDQYAFATITGIYEALDPGTDWWLNDPQLIHPVIRALSLEVQLLDAALLVDPGTHGALARYSSPGGQGLRYSFREFLDPERISDRTLAGLITDFHRLLVAYPSANVTPATDTALRTGMAAMLETHQARWAAAEGIIAVMALGPALVGIATLGLIAVLAARRRQATMALARSRGASGRQVVVPTIVEGLLIAVPGAIVAAAIAVALVPAAVLSPTVVAAAAVVAIAVTVVTATVVSIVRSRGPGRRDDDRVVARVGTRRVVLEGLIVVLAIGGAYLLRERGLNAVSSAGAVRGFDPLIAAVPVLVGVAAGIVVVRLYPVALRGVAAVARRGRGLVLMLAARRATEGGASSAVLLVLLATATVAAFAAASLDSLDRGAETAAWQSVGGSYRLQAPSGALPADLDAAALPGVAIVAGVFEGSAPIGPSGPQSLFAIADAGPMATALAGTPADPHFPDGFATPGAGAIPVIISTELAQAPRGVKLGEQFQASVEGFNLTYRVAEVRDGFAGLPRGRPWVLAPREGFVAQAPGARLVPIWTMVDAPSTTPDALRAAVTAMSPSVDTTSQAEEATALRTAPVTQAVRGLILAAALVTAAYAALGVAAALALSGIDRTVEIARLRTLGLTGRQAVGLAVAEHGPTTVTGFVVGGLLGVALFALLRSALGLAGLVGSPVDVPVVLEPGPLLLIFIGMIAVVAIGLGLGAALQRRVAPTAALRGRFE
jgi:putative ABC transport system permease protein